MENKIIKISNISDKIMHSIDQMENELIPPEEVENRRMRLIRAFRTLEHKNTISVKNKE